MEFLVPASIFSAVVAQPKSLGVSYHSTCTGLKSVVGHSTDTARTVVDHIKDLINYVDSQMLPIFFGVFYHIGRCVVDHTIGLWYRSSVPLKEGA
ncbi:MAG TPA: hypothetical protein DIU37_00595 [Opitutae bacterium]|nr:hypothetical protein [Opitutae bacterium]